MPEPPDLTPGFEAAGLIDVAYTVADSPLGPLLLAGTRRGLLRVAYPNVVRDDALGEIARLVSPRVIAAPARLDDARRQLDEYFAGRRQTFELGLDRRLMRPGFFRRVLSATAKIPYGSVSSYKLVAGAAGNPGAFRSAGTALGANPLPVVIPCHRVLSTGGGLGGYAGGPQRKSILLELEESHP